MSRSKLLAIVVGVALAGVIAWYVSLGIGWIVLGRPYGVKPTKQTVSSEKPADDVVTDDAERLAYIKSSIELDGLQIGPKLKPGSDGGSVPGLLEVSGRVLNQGERGIRTVNLVVHLQDDKEQVIGTFIEDVLHDAKLPSHQSRPFSFEIPEKKEYRGHYLHELR
jgi:hypothetical protein